MFARRSLLSNNICDRANTLIFTLGNENTFVKTLSVMSDDVNNKILFGLCHTETLALI